MKEKIKCQKCGLEMVRGEPYMHKKEEGDAVCKISSNSYYCDNQKCEIRYKVIKII